MTERIGTCSHCGGAVVAPYQTDNQTPHCEQCGAVPNTRVIPMQPAPRLPRPSHLTYIGDNDAPQWLLDETVVRRSQG